MTSYRDVYYLSADGLRLHARDYDQAPPGAFTVLCMPGLTRNARDFDSIAGRLAPRYRVVVAEQRGRGLSAYDPNPENYLPPIYVGDMIALLDQLHLGKVAIIGTSLGGLLAMMLGAMQPDRFVGFLLNDVGPSVSVEGLERIRAYIGRVPEVTTWEDAARDIKEIFGAAFPAYEAADWDKAARALYRANEAGVPVLDHDPNIAVNFNKGPVEIPDLWPLFDALPKVPIAVVRGALSNLLTRETVEEMKRRRPDIIAAEVSNVGHAPTLDEPEAVELIERYLARISQSPGAGIASRGGDPASTFKG